MNYYIDLFSPETAKAYSESDKKVSGYRITQKSYVQKHKIGPGDIFICYVTRIQRLIGLLEVISHVFIEEKPIFTKENDPFTLRFQVKPIVWLPFENAIPIHEDILWMNLSFTKNLVKDSNRWTYMVFASPRLWPKEDSEIIEKSLLEQNKKLLIYPFSEDDKRKLNPSKIRIKPGKEIIPSVPEDSEENLFVQDPKIALKEKRQSYQIQAKLAEIGEKLNLKIWLPKSDRSNVLEIWKPNNDVLLDELPLVFDETTLKTIKNIDLLWIQGRSILRAFEVEDTTSIYSGILRMADLLSLQPMLDIKIHIVAPLERRNEVFKQISRPVFSVMEKGPLAESCSFISYNSVIEISKEKRLHLMTHSIVDEFSEFYDAQ